MPKPLMRVILNNNYWFSLVVVMCGEYSRSLTSYWSSQVHEVFVMLPQPAGAAVQNPDGDYAYAAPIPTAPNAPISQSQQSGGMVRL
jgi:hypothetical protein